MSYDDDEDDSKVEAQAAQELLAEGWQEGHHGPPPIAVDCRQHRNPRRGTRS